MEGQGRREKLKTVESLVILMLQDPNQTRKDLMDRMTNHTHDENRPEELRGISRQSVYKALDFLRDAGILFEKSDQTVFRINKRTIKSITVSIDMTEVRKRYADLWTEKFTGLDRFKNLPDNAKKIVLDLIQARFMEMDNFDKTERNELLKLQSESIGNNGHPDSAISEYLKLEYIDMAMEYLRLFSEMKD